MLTRSRSERIPNVSGWDGPRICRFLGNTSHKIAPASPALRVVEPFPWRIWAAATLAMTLVAAFALLAYYRPSAAKRLFAQAVTAAVAVAKAIVDAVTVAAPPPPPPTPSPVASEHPESLMF